MNARVPQSMAPASGTLMTLDEATQAIRNGKFLCLAGDEALLRKLPKGNWIAGTTPYFMGPAGGESTRQRLFVTEMPMFAATPAIQWYDESRLPHICTDAPAHGMTMLIVPAFSEVHSLFAHQAPTFEDMFLKPLLGWIAGIHLDDLGKTSPAVANGQTLEFSHDKAIALHIPLPDTVYPRIDIVNLFRPGKGDRIRFPSTGFSARECYVNDKLVNFAQYTVERGLDTRLPLVADYSGAMINVSFKAVDAKAGRVDFYAPVFDDAEYRLADPVADYASAFVRALPAGAQGASWSCNCILNYLYSKLEGQRTGAITGPITFGEIAYQLLNQTLVFLTLETL